MVDYGAVTDGRCSENYRQTYSEQLVMGSLELALIRDPVHECK